MTKGPPSEKFSPLAQTSGYATDCGGRHFSTRPGEALPHVGSLGPQSMGWNQKRMAKGQKMGRAEAIQTGVVHFQRYITMLVCVCLKRRYTASSFFRPPINLPGSTGRYIQLFSLKSTPFTVEKKLESQQTMFSI